MEALRERGNLQAGGEAGDFFVVLAHFGGEKKVVKFVRGWSVVWLTK